MEVNNSNSPTCNLRLTDTALENLPKYERPLRIKLGATNNPLTSIPKTEILYAVQNKINPPIASNVENSEPVRQIESNPRSMTSGNNVYINVNIFFSKNLSDILNSKPQAEEKPTINKINVNQSDAQPNIENHQKTQQEFQLPLRIIDHPVKNIKPIKPLRSSNGHSNQMSSLFDNSQLSDNENYSPLHKRELNEIKCACHHLHVNDNVKLSRFSYKSQLRKIKVRWAGLNGDFPIVFKRKFMRFEDDCENISINEVVDFSRKLIQPDCENDIFGVGEHF